MRLSFVNDLSFVDLDCIIDFMIKSDDKRPPAITLNEHRKTVRIGNVDDGTKKSQQVKKKKTNFNFRMQIGTQSNQRQPNGKPLGARRKTH